MDNDNHQLLLKEIERDEGFRSSAYLDSLGFLTIGIGTLIDARKNGGISHAAALFMLSEEVANIEKALDDSIPWWKNLSGPRRRVLLNMSYNLGVSGLLAFKKTLQLIKDGQYEKASEEMLRSRWAAQVGDRAQRLSTMMKGGSQGPSLG